MWWKTKDCSVIAQRKLSISFGQHVIRLKYAFMPKTSQWHNAGIWNIQYPSRCSK